MTVEGRAGEIGGLEEASDVGIAIGSSTNGTSQQTGEVLQMVDCANLLILGLVSPF